MFCVYNIALTASAHSLNNVIIFNYFRKRKDSFNEQNNKKKLFLRIFFTFYFLLLFIKIVLFDATTFKFL